MKKYRIEGVIGWDSTPNGLAEFLESAGGQDVAITISSPGGLVGQALDMFNQIRNYSGKVTAILSGYAMSAASYIPMAADEVVAEDNAIMMIHNAQGIAWGDHNTMFKTGNIMKGMSAMIAGAYSKFTGKDKVEISEMMDVETWFFGEEIAEAGFAHSTIKVESGEDDGEAATAKARFAFGEMVAKVTADAKMFHDDLGQAATALGSMGAQPPQTKKEVIEMLTLEKLKSDHPELVDAISKEATAGFEEKLAAARQEGITAENARVKEVMELSIPGHEALITQLAFDGKTTGPEAAVQLVKAAQANREKGFEDFKASAAPVIPQKNGDENMTAEQKAKAGWDKDAQLRADFNGDFSKYTAYLAENEGIRFKKLNSKGE